MKSTHTQKEWLSGFSRAGFLLPGIYLLRARQIVFALLVIIGPFILGYILPNALFGFVLSLVIRIVIGIKGRQLAFDKIQTNFKDLQISYKKISKIIKILFGVVGGILFIGVFAAALIPRLSSARGRANDVARKADLAMTASALVSYQIDNGQFPPQGGCLSDIQQSLLSAGLSTIPMDPTSNTFNGTASLCKKFGQYMYIPLIKNGSVNGGFVVMAKTETEGGTNRVATSNNAIGIGKGLDSVEKIIPCRTITQGLYNTNSNGICTYIKGQDVLRYIYLY